MSSTTPNLGLIKPSETDIIDIGNINTNSDKIDISYKNMADQAKQLSEQIKTAQETLTNMNLLIEANKNAITQLNSDWKGTKIKTVRATDFYAWARSNAVNGRAVPFMATGLTNHPFSTSEGIGFLYYDTRFSGSVWCAFIHKSGAEIKKVG